MSEKKSLNSKNLRENALDDAELDKVTGGVMNDISTPSLLDVQVSDKPEIKTNSSGPNYAY